MTSSFHGLAARVSIKRHIHYKKRLAAPQHQHGGADQSESENNNKENVHHNGKTKTILFGGQGSNDPTFNEPNPFTNPSPTNPLEGGNNIPDSFNDPTDNDPNSSSFDPDNSDDNDGGVGGGFDTFPPTPFATTSVAPPVAFTPQSSSVPFTQDPAFPTAGTSPNASRGVLTASAASVSSAVATKTSVPSSGTTSSSKSHSTTGIAVGVTIVLVALLASAAVFWILRKRKIKERTQWRSSWKAGLYPALESKRNEWNEQEPSVATKLMSDKATYEPTTPTTPNTSKPLPDILARRSQFVVPPVTHGVVITPPPNTLNNPGNSKNNTIYQTPVASTTTINTTPATTLQQELARVRRGFLPTLPDELPIAIGETVQILMAYDDGWSLCRNSRGDRGMVPLECLQREENLGGHGEMGRQEANGDAWRMSKRASSLYAGVTPQDGY